MKKVFLISFLLLWIVSQAQWIPISISSNQWYRIQFGADQAENIGYVSSNSYFWSYNLLSKSHKSNSKPLQKTFASDFWGTQTNGQTWDIKDCGPSTGKSDCIQSFHFADDGLFGLAVTLDGIIKKTLTGSQEWIQDDNPNPFVTHFLDCWTDGEIGVIVGYGVYAYPAQLMTPIIMTNQNIKTSSNWEVYLSPFNNERQLLSVTGTYDALTNSYIIYALDPMGTIYKNCDNTFEDWTITELPDALLNKNVVDIKVSNCNPDLAYCVGSVQDKFGMPSGLLYKTENRGTTWNFVPSIWPVSALQVNSIEFSGPKFNCALYATGKFLVNAGYILKSEDQGITWTIDLDGNFTTPLYDIFFTKNSGYTVGNGIIAKLTGYPCGYSSGGKKRTAPTSLKSVDVTHSEKENDILVYPNPAKDIVNVTYTNAESQSLSKIELFNHTGEKLSSIGPVNANQVYYFDLSQYPPGIYLIRILNFPNKIVKFLKIN